MEYAHRQDRLARDGTKAFSIYVSVYICVFGSALGRNTKA